MPDDSHPNVLLIHCHDLGQHLGCYGADVATPNIDRIADEGHRMANHFCAAPLCSPARGALHTGRYPPRNGLIDNCHGDGDWSSLREGERTLADHLGDAGYRTTMIGHQMLAADNAYQMLAADAVAGFDEVHTVESEFAHELPDGVDSYLAEASDRPFFASVGFHETHRLGWNREHGFSRPESIEDADHEIHMGAPDYDQYRPSADDLAPLDFLPEEPGIRQDHAGLHAMIHALDEAVGRILDSLDRHGLADETLVAFTADHGLAFPRAKTTCYDAGIETPMLLRYPGVVDGGEVHEGLASHVDFLPTVLDMLDVPVPADLDGESYLPVLRGEQGHHRDHVCAFFGSGPSGHRAIRTDRWKYIRSYGQQSRPGGGDGYAKYGLAGGAYYEDYYEPPAGEQLYDLDADPTEQENLAGDSAVAEEVRSLRERLLAVMQDTGDPLFGAELSRESG